MDGDMAWDETDDVTLGVVMDVFRSNMTYRFLSIRNSFVQEKWETLIEHFIEEADEENNQHGLPQLRSGRWTHQEEQ
jgi:hypothetical protein